MRGSGLCASLASARFQDHNPFIPGDRFPNKSQKLPPIPLYTLKMNTDHLGLRVLDQITQGIHLVNIHFVAEIYELVEVVVEIRQEPVKPGFIKPGLKYEGKPAPFDLADRVKADVEI